MGGRGGSSGGTGGASRIHHVDQWYDRSSRNWVTQRKDAQGNQVGSAFYDGSRASAAISLQTANEHIGLTEVQVR